MPVGGVQGRYERAPVRHEGPGFKASKIRTKGSFLYGENGNLLGFPNSVSNQPSQQVQRYRATGEPFPAAVQPSHAIGFHPTSRETCASRRGRGHQRQDFIGELAEGKGPVHNMLCPKAA